MNRSAVALACLLAGALSGTPALAANVVPPTFQSCGKPVLPDVALHNEYQGTVMLALLLDVDGDIQEARVEQSSGYPILDQAAAEYARSCKFTPSRVNGRALPRVLKMPINWNSHRYGPQDVMVARTGAERGDATAQYLLGKMYLHANGVGKDNAEAERWLRQAAEQGVAGAQDELAVLLIPNGGSGDAEQSLNWFRKAAEQGRARSQYYLGTVLLRQGQTDEAIQWLRKSAAQSYPGAQAKLAGLPEAR